MAYYDDTYNDVQFLDLTGIDEEEKKWILASLHTYDPCVEGPWSKSTLHGEEEMAPLTAPEYQVQSGLNGLPPLSYEQYSSPPVIISNHCSPISPQVYPQSYQSPIPMYQPAFVSGVQYGGPISVMPAAIMPVPMAIPNASYCQTVTYASYAPAVQAGPIYNIPAVVKESTMSAHCMPPTPDNHHQPQHCHPPQQSLPPMQHHVPSNQPKASPVSPMQPAKNPQVASKVSPATSIQQSPPQVAQITNGLEQVTLQNASPESHPPKTPANEGVNGHNEHVHMNGAGSDTMSDINTSPNALSDNASTHSSSTLSAPPILNESDTSSKSSSSSNRSGTGMSWASLFNKKQNNVEDESLGVKTPLSIVVPTPQINNNDSSNGDTTTQTSFLAKIGDPSYYRMGEVLVHYAPDNRITSLQPRGLINRSNYCYINSILQAMLACPPMYNLLNALGQNVTVKEYRKHTQIIDNMVKFVNEFHHLPAAQRVNRRSNEKVQKKDPTPIINYDRPFEPNWIYKMLNGIRSDSFVVEGRQEDAEEFLGCLLNGLNDEMLELMKLVGPQQKQLESPTVSEDGYKSDSDWQVIGPKNKGCITRRTEIVRTPISDIFGGHIRSKLHRAGDQSTNNIQPFFTLQLNIEKVNTVREALEALVCKNQLEGVTSSKTNEEVEAWQQVTIEELPLVLILHLKCFDFQLDGCTKIIKALEFPVDLKIDSKLLSSKTNYQPKEKQYKLFAVVYHEGKEATKGHYLTDAYHVGYASWLRYDDSTVKSVQEEQVLKPHGTRVPYLLFYRRSDTVRNK